MTFSRLSEQLDTRDTPYSFVPLSRYVVALESRKDFLSCLGLKNLEDFTRLTGEVVDRNRRSVVHKLYLGDPPETFYLKLHKNYAKRSWRNLFILEPMILKELRNMMDYARAGFDALEPVAWGWRPAKGGGESFLMVTELQGYRSLQTCLEDPALMKDPKKVKGIVSALAHMLSTMHKAGLAHIDLFSWHVFVKFKGEEVDIQPIDLERTKRRGNMPWAEWTFERRKIDDLTALNLTTPSPLVPNTLRMRFYLTYRGHSHLDAADKKLVYKIMARCRYRGRKAKFDAYGVSRLK